MTFAGHYVISVPADTGMSADLANFTFPFTITDSHLKSVANGGVVTQNAGAGIPDVGVFTDATYATAVKHGRHYWDPVGGTISGEIKIPIHSKTTGQFVYLAAGNASVVADQQDRANAHDANYTEVWYGGDGSTLDVSEWVSGANFTNNNSVAAAAGPFTGIGAGAFVSASTRYLERAAASPTSAPVTIEVIFKPSTIAATQVLAGLNNVATNASFTIQARATGVLRALTTGATAPDTTANAVVNNAWNYGAAVLTSGTSRAIHGNSNADVTSSASFTPSTPNTTTIGANHGASVSQAFDGWIACVRISNTSRSRDWREAVRKSWSAGFYSVGSWTPAASPATAITTPPPSSVTSGVAFGAVAKATTDGSTVDTAFTGNCVVTVASGPGTLSGTTTVACVAGVATFSNLILTGDGADTVLQFAMTGYASASSAAIAIIGAVVAANQALVAAFGADTVLFGTFDYRVNRTDVSGKASALADALKGVRSNTVLPNFAQATAGSRPTVSSGLVFAGAESMEMATADSRFDLSLSPGVGILLIASGSGDGYLAGIAADPASATTYPYAMIQSASSNWKGDYASTGSGDRNQPDTKVARTGGATRAVMLERNALYGGTAGSGNANGDVVWRMAVGGRQHLFMHWNPAPTAGSLKAVLGKLGSTFGSGTVKWVGFVNGDMTAARWSAFLSFAASEHGATMETSKRGTLVFDGNSRMMGRFSTDEYTYPDASGTTSPIGVAMGLATGRGTWATQGFDAVSQHAINHGVGSKTLAIMASQFPENIGVLVDGQRAGPAVAITWEIHNSSSTQTAAQMIASIQAYTDACHAVGMKHYPITCPDAGSFYSGGDGTGTLNARGTAAMDVNTAIRAGVGTLCDGYIDLEANTNFTINKSVPRACTSTTYYRAALSDYVHQTDTGYALVGQIIKDHLDAHDEILWPGLASVATSTWSVPSPVPAMAASVAPSVATRTWTAPAPSATPGAVTASPATATGTWTALSPAVTMGSVTAQPSPATQTWTALSPSAGGSGTPLVGSPAAAVGAWSTPSPAAAAAAAASPVVATRPWNVPSPAVALGTIVLTPLPALVSWAVRAPFFGVPGATVQVMSPTRVVLAPSKTSVTLSPSAITLTD